MAFEVSIKITAESQLEAVKAAEAAVQRVGATAKQVSAQTGNLPLLGPGMIETAKGSGQAAAAVAGFGVKTAQLRPLIVATAAQLGGMGKGASLLGGGLGALVIGGLTPVGVALAAGAIAMGAWSSAAATAAEKAKQLEEINKNFSAGIKASNERLTELSTATAQVGRDSLIQIDIQKKAALAKIDAELEAKLTSPGFRDQDEDAFLRREMARNAALRERRAIEAAAAAQIEQSHTQELRAVARMDAALATNTALRKENELQMARQKGASEQIIKALEQEAAAANKRIRDIDAAEKAARGGEASDAFLQQISQLGQKVKEALSRPIGPAQIAEFKGALEGMAQAAMQKWGVDVPSVVEGAMSKVGATIDKVAQIKQITPVEINAEQPFRELAAIQAKGEALRALLSKPIKMTVEADVKSSPARPFSEWFDSYAPGKIEKFSEAMKGTEFTISSNITGLIDKAMDRLLVINSRLADFNFGDRRGFGPTFGDALLAERRGIIDTISMFGGGRSSGGSAGGGGGGGGGGGVTNNITIDMRDALITGDVIQGNLLPELRNLIRQTTGKDPGFRVLN